MLSDSRSARERVRRCRTSNRPPICVLVLVAAVVGVSAIAGTTHAEPVGLGVGTQTETSEKHREWLQIVEYIIDDQEKAIFEALSTTWQRERFIADFWKRRDPLPVTPENEFYIEHMRRWTYANDVLGRDTPTPGWRTDRGRVYIANGPPFKVHPYPNTQQLWPLEVWEYRDTDKPGMPGFYQIIFFKPRVFNEWRLYSPSVDGPEGLVISSPADMELVNFQQLATKFPIVFTAATRVAAGYSGMESEAVIARTMMPPPPPRPLAFNAEGEAEAAFLTGGPLDMAMDVTGFVHADLEGYLDVTVEIPAAAGAFVEFEDVFVANYEVELEIATPAAGTWREPGGQLVVRIPKSEFEAVRDLPVVYRERLWLLPGDYRVRALLRERSTRRVGAVEVEATVPARSDLVVGAASLFYVTEGDRGDWDRIIPWVGDQLRRGYPVGSRVRIATDAEEPAARDAAVASLQLDYRVRQGTETVWSATWSGEEPARPDGDDWTVVQMLDLQALPAGTYEFEVRALRRDAGSAETVDLGLVDRRRLELVDDFLPFARILPVRSAEVAGAEAHHQIGQQFLRADDFELAGEHFRTAVRLDPQTTAYQIDAAKTLMMADDLDLAEFFLEGAVNREPRNAEAWTAYGLLRVRQTDFDGAIEAYRRSLDLAPGTPAVYNGLAESFLSRGEPVRAIEMLELSLEINPAQQQVRQLRDQLKSAGQAPDPR